jgi:hypothetical protein
MGRRIELRARADARRVRVEVRLLPRAQDDRDRGDRGLSVGQDLG